MGDSIGGVGSIGADGGAAAVPASAQNQTATGADSNQSDPPNLQATDDPEWDIGDGKKAKRSEFLKRQKDFEKGFYKAAQSKSQVEGKFNALAKSLQRYGISDVEGFLQNPDEHMSRAAQDLIARQVDESLMDPREREISQRERALQEREEKQAEYDKKQAEDAREQRVGQHIEQITQEWAPALKQSGLPANPKTVARMADVMKAGLAKGIKLDANECAQYVAEQMNQEQEWHRSQHKDAESFVGSLTAEQVEWVRQSLLKQHKQATTPRPKPTATPLRADDGKYMGWGQYTDIKNQRRI